MKSVNFKSNLGEKLDKNSFLFYDKGKIKNGKKMAKIVILPKKKNYIIIST